MGRRGVVEILGLAVATPVMALAVGAALIGMAAYGKRSGWAAERTRTERTECVAGSTAEVLGHCKR